MEIAKKLFNKHSYSTDIDFTRSLNIDGFIKALTEHDQSIIDMIEDVIKLTKDFIECDIPKENCDRCESFTKVFLALTKLELKIEESSK